MRFLGRRLADLFYAAVFFEGGYFSVPVAWGIKLLNGVAQVRDKGKKGKKCLLLGIRELLIFY